MSIVLAPSRPDLPQGHAQRAVSTVGEGYYTNMAAEKSWIIPVDDLEPFIATQKSVMVTQYEVGTDKF